MSGLGRFLISKIAVIAASACLLYSAGVAAQWPQPAGRSAGYLPASRDLDIMLSGSGAYVPHVSNLSSDSSGVLFGEMVWNYAFVKRLGLYGQHSIMGMWWANVALLGLGHEIGVRYLCTDLLTFEAGYLGHRVDRGWVDGHETRPGGVVDNGGEISARLRFEPLSRLRVEGRFVSRIFRVYNDTQGVTGLSLRVSFLPVNGHSVELELEGLRTVRSLPRPGVEQVTWNVVGAVRWLGEITPRMGIAIGGRISTNLMVGQVPMLELKRSMIDEPMALVTLGIYFGI